MIIARLVLAVRLTGMAGVSFKQYLTAGVKTVVERQLRDADWWEAGQGWRGVAAALGLAG
ncbi:MAG: hypothetical protein EOM91_01670 [Sphingobacteriia bacterium]|nr:hypothetical protein [Sphingobacteriia bacterium]NCC38811.1 hypothetical protein [Gammaproteobacteria bacterium]